MRIIIVILFLCNTTFCQESNDIPVVNQNFLDVSDLSTLNTYGAETFDNRNKKIEGSVFLNDDWNSGDIKIVNDKVYSQYRFKFNMLDQNLIIKVKDRFFELPGLFIESFVLNREVEGVHIGSRKFIRKINDDQTVSFLEVLVDGKYSLCKLNEAEVKKASYNPVLDTGNVGDKILLNTKYILNFNNISIEIPKKKKKFEKSFGNYYDIILTFRSSKFNLSDEESLKVFASKLNAVNIN